MTFVDTIFHLFREKGQGLYFGENVTETEHALQCAHLAEQSGAAPEMIAAALLHDIGHLLHGLPEDVAERGVDGRHEDCGAQWLAKHFDLAVVDPVRLHVAAKRYLCAVDPNYRKGLSEASERSLSLQGGPMTMEEVRQFEQHRYCQPAVHLRLWDDDAKVPGLDVPDLEHYRSILETVVTNPGVA